MNVLKGNYISKKNLKNDNRSKLKKNFSGFHSVIDTVLPPRFPFSTANNDNFNLNTPNPQKATSSRVENSVTEEGSSTKSFLASRSDNVVPTTDNQSLENSPLSEPLDNESLNTSTEFQKLMRPFHNLKNPDFIGTNETSIRLKNLLIPKSLSEIRQIGHNPRKPKSNLLFGKFQESVLSNSSRLTINGTPAATVNFKKSNVLNDIGPKKQRKKIRDDFDVEFHECSSSSLLIETPTTSKDSTIREFSSSKRESSTFSKTPKRTGKSPRTPGSGWNFPDAERGSYILAVTEGRGQARGEVGLAAMDPKRPHLIMCQISDNQRYIHSLTKMNIFNFIEVIVPNTFIDGPSHSKLYADIRARFPTVTLTSVQRRHFSEGIGIELTKQYCSPESTSVMVILHDKFYALSAAAALIKYIEFTQNVVFAPRSLKVEYQGTEETMIIDSDTANRLELVMSATFAENSQRNTLLGAIKHCHTKGGIRLLRANILQPPCSLKKISYRLDCVSELISSPLIFNALEAAVSSFSNVENLLSLCMHAPRQDGLQVAESQLKYTLLLKTILELLPSLLSALQDAKSDYFCEVKENLGDLRFRKILDRILETVFENAKTVKGSISAHLHGCFAIKTGVNSLLDIAKKTYCEIVQEISEHIHKLRETHNLPLRMSFSVQKGFHIQYTLAPTEKGIKASDLPKEFILVQKSRSTFSFYTSELVAMDQRSQQVLNEIKLMTNVILFELLNDVRQHIGCLFNLCEYIAELDVIISFAHVGSGVGYVRPKFNEKIDLKNSRHPILDVIYDGKVIPNDVAMESGKNFMILTGPNQSGKSIYIRQIALLQVMAQIGCYVPASEATFRVTDKIFSRIGFDDSIESNASTLVVEMKDIEYIKQNLGVNSLVIIDELCRGTSVDEGTTLAFAICEELVDSSAFICLTTHYIFLTKLEELYFNVSNYHFETKINTNKKEKNILQFSHRRLPGVTDAESYGLQVAEMTTFPNEVLNRAKDIARELLKERKPFPDVSGMVSRYDLSQKLKREIMKFEPDLVWSHIEPTVRQFHIRYLELTKLKDISCQDEIMPEESQENRLNEELTNNIQDEVNEEMFTDRAAPGDEETIPTKNTIEKEAEKSCASLDLSATNNPKSTDMDKNLSLSESTINGISAESGDAPDKKEKLNTLTEGVNLESKKVVHCDIRKFLSPLNTNIKKKIVVLSDEVNQKSLATGLENKVSLMESIKGGQNRKQTLKTIKRKIVIKAQKIALKRKKLQKNEDRVENKIPKKEDMKCSENKKELLTPAKNPLLTT